MNIEWPETALAQYRCVYTDGRESSWRDYKPDAHHAPLNVMLSLGAERIELRWKEGNE